MKRFLLLSAALTMTMSSFSCAGASRRSAASDPAIAGATVTEGMLIGSWTSTNPESDLVGSIALEPGQAFSSTCRRGKAIVSIEGKWYVHNNVLVWIYGNGTEDPNPIIEFAPDRVKIKEVSGSITTLTREN